MGLEYQYIFARNNQMINRKKYQSDYIQQFLFWPFMSLRHIMNEYPFNQSYPFKIDRKIANLQLRNNNRYE